MTFQTLPIPATTHCVVCGSNDVAAMCHHCDAPLCESHLNYTAADRRRWRWIYPIMHGFVCYDEIPEFDALSFPEPPEPIGGFPPDVILYQRINTFLYYQWEWILYLIMSVYAWFRLHVLARPLLQSAPTYRSVHCPLCLHYVTSYFPLLRAGFFLCCASLFYGLLAIIGNLFKASDLFNLSPVLLVFVLGTFLLFCGLAFNLLQYLPALRHFAPEEILIDCALDSLKVEESIQGIIQLDHSGRYRSSVHLPGNNVLHGLVQVGFRLDEHSIDGVLSFENRMRNLGVRRVNLPVKLGAVLLNGGWWILQNTLAAQQQFGEWRSSQDYPANQHVLVPPNHPEMQRILRATHGAEIFHTDRAYDYPLQEIANDQISLPCQVIVALAPHYDQHVIDLEVEPTPTGPEMAGARIVSLCLDVPAALGQVAICAPLARVEHLAGGHATRLTWENLYFENTPGAKRFRKNLRIQLQQKLPDLQDLGADANLTGMLRLQYPQLSIRSMAYRAQTYTQRPYRGPLTGNPVLVMNAFGHRLDTQIEPEWVTQIFAALRLDLHGLQKGTVHRNQCSFSRAGISPTNLVVSRIVDVLNQKTTSNIKRVTENPPPVNRQNANALQQYWNLHGRAYDGLYPIDYHIELTGQEDFADPRSSQFEATISVAVVDITPHAGSSLSGRADQLMHTLAALVQSAL